MTAKHTKWGIYTQARLPETLEQYYFQAAKDGTNQENTACVERRAWFARGRGQLQTPAEE